MFDSGNMTTVLGAGTMGAGIAQSLADHGFRVTLCDVDSQALERARDRIAVSRRTLESAGLQTHAQSVLGASLLTTSCLVEDVAPQSDLIIESISENLEVKTDVFRQLDRLAPSHAAIVSNTSGLSETSPVLIERLMTLARELGKQPIHVRRDVPGFVANRLQFAVFREALHLLEEDVVSAADLDRAITGGPGFRWPFLGPLQTADFGGLDIFHSIASYLWEDLSDAKVPPPLLEEKLKAGKLGTKSGAGFYEYSAENLADLIGRRDRFLLGLKQLVHEVQSDGDLAGSSAAGAGSSRTDSGGVIE